MKILTKISVLILAITFSSAKCLAQENAKTFNQKVYLFGTAVNHQDSTTYITGIMPIENVTFNKKREAIIGLELYSAQLQDYLLQQGHTGYICTTFFETKANKLEKKFIKLKKHLKKDKTTSFKDLPEFKFEYVSPENIFRNVPQKPAEDEEQAEQATE